MADAAQEAIDGANQTIALMEAVKENITRLQQRIETLDSDLETAQEKTSVAKEEARLMREEVISARQEIQRLSSQLVSEKAFNNSLRERLRDLGHRFSSLQDAFRAGFEAFSTVYQRAQSLVLDTNDTRIDEFETAQTLVTASSTEPPLTSSHAPIPSAPTSPASDLSSLAEAPTPSSPTESTNSTRDIRLAGSISATSPPTTDSAPTSRTVTTVDCYAMVALGNEDSGVSLATQSTACSSLITKPARRFRNKAWRLNDISDNLKRNLESWGQKDLSPVLQVFLECAHSGTSGVICEANSTEQICGVAVAATNLAIQVGENHEYMKLLAEKDKKGVVCPSVVIVTSSGELVSQISSKFAAYIQGNGNKGSAIDSVKVIQRTGEDGKSLTGLDTNLPTILVCTPGRLTDLIRQPKFSAHLLHLLVVCQGQSLASADFASEMQKIIVWARSMQPCPTGEQPISMGAACPLTTIVLSRSFERDSALHRQLTQRYRKDFICATNVNGFNLGKRPLIAFKGKIEVQTCAFKVVDRSKYFVEEISPLHRDESILCMDFSQTRAAELTSECRKLGVASQVFTTDRDNSKTIQHFRTGECKIMFTTPAGFEGIHYEKTKTGVIFASPCESLFTDEDGCPRPRVYNRRTDLLRAAIESIGQAEEDATIYIFVASSTKQPVKDDIAKVLGEAGYEVPGVLKPRTRIWY